MSDKERLEIVTRCLRNTKNDQLWDAYAWEAYTDPPGRIGPTVQSHSRKSVRTKARTAFEHSTNEPGTPREVGRRTQATATREGMDAERQVGVPITKDRSQRKEIPMERYVAGRWDDNSFNVYDRENEGKALSEWGGYMSLDDAQEAARKLNEENDAAT